MKSYLLPFLAAVSRQRTSSSTNALLGGASTNTRDGLLCEVKIGCNASREILTALGNHTGIHGTQAPLVTVHADAPIATISGRW